MKLWVKILIGLFLGVIVGIILGPNAIYLKPIGTVFLSLINMIIVLLILSSMTVGITSIHDPQKLGRVGLKTLGFYFITTVISITIGLLVAKTFNVSLDLISSQTETVVINTEDIPSLSEILLSIIPNNPVAALVEGNMLQIIVFALFLGISINFAGEKGKPLLAVLESLADVMYRLTSIIMEFSPVGVFAIMAWVAGSFGVAVLVNLGKFLLTFYLAAFLHVFLVFVGTLWFILKLNPVPFFKGLGDTIMMAFSTSSSSATLPVTMHCVQENLGVSKNISSFVLPLGSTVNMNGTAMFQAMAAVFVANSYGIELSFQSLLTVIVTATLSAVGAAGIPGTGYIMLTVVFTSVGIPLEGLGILAGIDRIREMVSTILNVLGDALTAVYVAKKEGEFDEGQYYHSELVEVDSSDA